MGKGVDGGKMCGIRVQRPERLGIFLRSTEPPFGARSAGATKRKLLSGKLRRVPDLRITMNSYTRPLLLLLTEEGLDVSTRVTERVTRYRIARSRGETR